MNSLEESDKSATRLWKPNEEEEKFVACVGRMALDSLAANGVADRATFVANLKGLAMCMERIPVTPKDLK